MGQQGYQQGCQQGQELSVSVVLVEQLRGGQWVMVLEQQDKQINSREFSTTETIWTLGKWSGSQTKAKT